MCTSVLIDHLPHWDQSCTSFKSLASYVYFWLLSTREIPISKLTLCIFDHCFVSSITKMCIYSVFRLFLCSIQTNPALLCISNHRSCFVKVVVHKVIILTNCDQRTGLPRGTSYSISCSELTFQVWGDTWLIYTKLEGSGSGWWD